jgi:hypothetical protein
MLRATLLCLGILAVTWLEFEVFPGHTYLQSGTQIYVPVLERLNAPGYLSRDLLSGTPDLVNYTFYDEVTLFLHNAGRLPFQAALQGQQLLFRLAAVAGIVLLARSTGLSDLFALLASALVNLGVILAGPAASLTDPEPIPAAFSAGLTLLAMGLFASRLPLLSGVMAGVALCYDPLIAGPFWLVLLIALAVDREMRQLVRPMLPILLIFVLLLANLAQLQPGVAAARQSLFSKLTPQMAQLQKFRTPYAWVSTWAARELWTYLAVAVLGGWAAARTWPVLNRPVRWLVLGVGGAGLLAVACSFVLLDWQGYAMLAEIQPSKTLVFTVALASLLFALTGMRAILSRRLTEAFMWFLLTLILPVNASLLEFLRLPGRLALCAFFAGAITLLLAYFRATRWRFAILCVPVAAMFALAWLSGTSAAGGADVQRVRGLAAWAERDTWGSSMFLFPDAGKQLYPGIFRAESRRAVWADWQSGIAVDYSAAGAVEWQSRWMATMNGVFSPQRVQAMLLLPIDYFVLTRANQLAGIRPVFTDDNFTVYDAQDLRNFAGPFKLAR